MNARIAFSLYPLTVIMIISSMIISGCSDEPDETSWWTTIPVESPMVILHHDADFFETLQEHQSVQLEELSQIRIRALSNMQEKLTMSFPTKAVALFPTGSHELQPVFILEDPGTGISEIAAAFRRDFAINNYRFHNYRIHILHLDDQQLYTVQLDEWIVMSKNSAAVENSILTYLGVNPALSVSEQQLAEGDYLLNTPEFQNWIKLLAAPRYLTRLSNLFEGTRPVIINVSDEAYDNPLYNKSLSGSIPLSPEESSPFVSAFSSEPIAFDLDRYIPIDAAFFALFQHPPPSSPDPDTELLSDLDSMFGEYNERFQEIAQTLASPAAFVAFEPGGFISAGEHLFLRRLENAESFVEQLDELEHEGYIEKHNDIFQVNSSILGRLMGGPLCDFTDFYIMRSADAAIITKRSGLARRIDQDRRRRAVFYYDDDYMTARSYHPDAVSAWMYARSTPLMNYLDPLLNPVNHAGFLATLKDIGAASLVNSGDELSFQFDTYFREDHADPVRDVWVYNLGGARITGRPYLSNIAGGARDELIIATDRNEVIGIAPDGTGFLEVQTGNDRPVGSPLVYDWYRNNQPAILVAAGNKIYAWNARGIPLPNFPVTMDEQITAPLVLADVARNGRPEMIVATADRKVHVLDQRGHNIQGWPQDVNVRVVHKPHFQEIDGEHTLWLTAGNGLFGFSPGGDRREGYPLFIESDFGPIRFHNNHILAGASDGHLYAIGRESLFAGSEVLSSDDAEHVEQENNDISVRRVYVGNSAIINAPIIKTLDMKDDDEGRTKENIIGVQTLNGNLFLLDKTGRLRMTRNMGQPSAEYDNMLITDLNGDGRPNIAGITHTGRIYAWEVESGEPVSDLPAASIRYPVVTDLIGNGKIELIGQTRDGLRCWSFQ